jgi:hypothetical protein
MGSLAQLHLDLPPEAKICHRTKLTHRLRPTVLGSHLKIDLFIGIHCFFQSINPLLKEYVTSFKKSSLKN